MPDITLFYFIVLYSLIVRWYTFSNYWTLLKQQHMSVCYFLTVFLYFLVCNKVKCGDRGCLKGDTNVERCCNEECLGGCFQLDSPHHCYACRHLRQRSNGECVKKCQRHLYEVKYLIVAGELIRGACNPNLQVCYYTCMAPL